MRFVALLGTLWLAAEAVDGFSTNRALKGDLDTVGTVEEQELQDQVEHGNAHRYLAFDSIEVFVKTSEIDYHQEDLAFCADAPFYFMDDLDTPVGMWYDTAIYTPDSRSGNILIVRNQAKNSLSLMYHARDPRFAIIGGTGKCVGATGEALFEVEKKEKRLVFGLLELEWLAMVNVDLSTKPGERPCGIRLYRASLLI